MKKILIIFGTRPEAIKMAPLVIKFKESNEFIVKVCVTAQHREMLDQVLNFFKIETDYDLDLMKPNQNLYQLTSDIIIKMKPVLDDFNPDFVFVHGDTTTSFAASLAAFYNKSKVCHIEAGLRTYEKLSPYPEEINRQLTSKIADYHFTPTILAKSNLLSENIPEDSIIITGNTVIDSLLMSLELIENNLEEKISNKFSWLSTTNKIVLITGHRRENFGQGFINICQAINEIATKHEDITIIYPVHLNPNVQKPVNDILGNIPNVILIPPLPYEEFLWLMKKAYIIITDSGGIQEEAPSLGKPVLVTRETTERPEALASGTIKLVGTDKALIISEVDSLLDNVEYYNKMSNASNPYGDGKSCQRILNFIKNI